MRARHIACIVNEVEALKKAGLYRRLPLLSSEQRPTAIINGKKVVNFSANNYLGLATHPKLREAAKKAIDDYGVGTGGARQIIGTMDIHEELERKIAEFKHTEAALVFPSGWMANAAAIGTLLSEGDVVISDELNHASIIDAIRLTKADREIFPHLDVQRLQAILTEVSSKQYRKILIVTDGVFSMDGDIAPLKEIVALSEKWGAITMVDDAHAVGVLGDHGRGTVSHFGLDGLVHIQMGTLSKAFGVVGGYIACDREFRELMEHRARPFLFSTSPPPPVIAACIAAIDLLSGDEGEELINRLWQNTNYFKKELNHMGFNIGTSQTPITPIIVGEENLAVQFSERLFEEGVFAQAVAYPTVPKGKARVRAIVTAQHSEAELQQALDAMQRVGKELSII